MRKRIFNLSTLLLISVFTALGVVSTYQFLPEIDKGKLNITGRIKTEKKRGIDSVKVVVMDSSGRKQIGDPYFTDKKGRFKFDLPYDQKFTVYYSKEGFVTMFNTFDTKVPREKKFKELYYDAAITMLSDSASYNRRAIARKPFMTVAFNDGFDMFIEDLDNSLAFVEELTEPNLGSVFLSGKIVDSLLNDTASLKIVAKDSLGLVVAETIVKPDGTYDIDLPTMSNLTLEFESEEHYPAFAVINTHVDSTSTMDDYNVQQDFPLVNKEVKDVNPAAFAIPIARIEKDPETGQFTTKSDARDEYEEIMWALRNRIVLAGVLINRDSLPFKSTSIQIMDGDVLADEYDYDTNYFEVPLPNQAITHVKIKSKGFHPAFISINTSLPEEAKDTVKRFDSEIELYDKDRSDINSDAFDLPMKKLYFDAAAGAFVADAAITTEFDNKLAEGVTPDTSYGEGLISLDCQVIDAITAKNVGKTKVRILDENKKVVSVINSDKTGKVQFKLGTNKIYYIELESDGHINTLNEFNTEVPEGYKDEDYITNPFLRILNNETYFEEKPIPEAISDSLPVTLFYFDQGQDHFAEDISYMTTFERSVINYVPPPPKKTGKELAEEEAAKKEALRAEAKAAVAAAAAAAAKARRDKELAEQGKRLRVNGKVVDEDGNPVDNVDIELVEGKDRIAKAETDKNGRFFVIAPYGKVMQMRFESKEHHDMFLNLTTTLPEGVEEKPDSFNLQNVKAYNKKSLSANPNAFSEPFTSVAYGANGASRKTWVDEAFAKSLNVTPLDQKLAIEGRVREGNNSRSIGNAKILVKNNGTVIDTINVDERGRFSSYLDYQKDYRLEVMKDGYFSTFTNVSTRVAQTEDPLIGKKIKSMKILLVNKADPDLNNSVFRRPYTRYVYNASKGEFTEVEGLSEAYLADLYIEKDKEKKSFQLFAKKVKADKQDGSKGNNDAVAKLGAGGAAAKRKSNQSHAKKAELMSDFHNMLNGVATPNTKRIKDVNLALQRIINTGYEVRGKQEKEIDESVLEAVKQLQQLNEIIASAMGFKQDAELVPLDSTFKVKLPWRRFHYYNKVNVHETTRDRVMSRDEIIDYVHKRDWYVFDDYYKNGEKIDEEHYQTELARIKKNSYLISVDSII